MEIIGHRGAKGLAPENTRDSIRAAIKAGVDWIEFDVHATADGRVVVIHDPHTARISFKPKLISKTKYSELKKLKTHSKLPILTIAEAFNHIGTQAQINVEIKSNGCAQAVVQNIERMVKSNADYEKYIVTSFKADYLRQVHKLNNKIQLGLLHSIDPYKFLRLHGLRIQAVGFDYRIMPAKAIHQAKLRELYVYAYTVNKLSTARKLLAKGVDGIVTNRPDILKDLPGEAEQD